MAEEYPRRTMPLPPMATRIPAGRRAIVVPTAGGEISMLVDFQRALADLTASPALCRDVRRTPEMLRARYALTDKE